MKPTDTTPSDSTQRSLLTLALAITVMLVASSPLATPFGDNDGGLDLPGMQDMGVPGAGGGSGNSSNQASSPGGTFGVISLSGADTVIVEVSDPTRGRVTLGTDQPVDLTVVDAGGAAAGAQATQSSSAQGLTAADEGALISLQGGALLPAKSPYERQLVSPVDAVASLSLLLVDSDPSASLENLLDSQVALDHWRVVDVPAAIDIDGLATLVGQRASELSPGGADVRVTWLIASLDSQGQLHFSATRVSTVGGPIEVLTR